MTKPAKPKPMSQEELEQFELLDDSDRALVESRWNKESAIAWAMARRTWPSRRFRVVVLQSAANNATIIPRLLTQAEATRTAEAYENMAHRVRIEQIIPDSPHKSRRSGVL